MLGLKGFIITSQGLIMGTVIPIAFGLCLFYFFWGVAKYIRSAGDEKAVEQGKQTMIWGVIALFVVFTIWGIIGFIRSELNLRGDILQVQKL